VAARRAMDRAAFDAVERADPSWSAVHLFAAMAWCFLLPIGRAPEAVAFGVLAAVAAIRLPSTWRLYPALLRSPALLLLAALAALHSASAAWATVPTFEPGAVFQRSILVPFMVWPMMHRLGLLVGALVAGGCVQSAATLARSWNGAGFDRYGQSKPLIGHLTTAAMVVSTCASAAVAAIAGRRSAWAAAAAALAVLLCLVALMVLDVRTSLAAVLPGGIAAVACALPARGNPSRWRRAALVTAVLSLAVAVTIVASNRTANWRAAVTGAELPRNAGVDPAFAAAGTRMAAWRGSLEMWRERPLLGVGCNSWEHEWKPRIAADPGRYGVPPDRTKLAAMLPGAHNAFLQELAERGAVGLALLLATLAAITAATWRRRGEWDAAAAAAILAVWIFTSLAQSQTIQGIPMMLLGVVTARACVPVRPAPPAQRPGPHAPASG